MHFDCDIYYGSIIKGDLRRAIAYVKQFPEKAISIIAWLLSLNMSSIDLTMWMQSLTESCCPISSIIGTPFTSASPENRQRIN